MQVFTLPDIVSHGAPITQQLTTDPTLYARWILFTATPTSGGPTNTPSVVASVGQLTDLSDGAHLADNTPVLYPQNWADVTEKFQLSSLQVYVGALWTLTITYGL